MPVSMFRALNTRLHHITGEFELNFTKVKRQWVLKLVVWADGAYQAFALGPSYLYAVLKLKKLVSMKQNPWDYRT